MRLTKLLRKDGSLKALSEEAKNIGLNMETLNNIEEVSAKLYKAGKA